MPDQQGSFIVSKETRALLGNDIVDFAERNIVNQKHLPIISPPDCGPDGKPSSSIKSRFLNAAADINQICGSFESVKKTDGTSYNHKVGGTSLIYYTDVLNSGRDFLVDGPLPGDRIKLPGSGKDWNAFILFHELQHSRDGNDDKPSSEYSADMEARKYYQQALQQNLVKDPGVPDAIRGTRVMTDMVEGMGMQDIDLHGVASLAGLPGIDIKDKDTENEAAKSIGLAKRAIYEEIGLPLMSDGQKEDLRAEGVQTAVPPEQWNLDALSQAKFDKYTQTDYQGDDHRRYADLNDILKGAHLSREDQDRAAKSTENWTGFYALQEGQKAVKEDPSLLYETARRLYLKGTFNGDLIQKAYTGEFVRAAETYGQDMFKTEGRHTIEISGGDQSQPQTSIAPSQQRQMQLAPAS